MSKRILNIGILAHVDAGKTTITEQLLFLGGAVKQAGNVDKGSATTDQLKIEKQRGISVKAATASFKWNDVQINLIDTPGHADFISEVERTLQILDCAILVISSAEGLQSHTYLLWNTLTRLKIPTLVFINKIDRPGSQFYQVLDSLNKEFKANIFPLSQIKNEAEKEVSIIDFKDDKFGTNAKFDSNTTSVSEFDEDILGKFLNNEIINSELLYKKAIDGFHNFKLTPVLAGVAKTGMGISNLLAQTINFVKPINYDAQKAVSAIVFGTEFHQKYGLLVHIKLLSGSLRNKAFIFNQRLNNDFKITQLKQNDINKIQDIDFLEAGDIGILAGLPEFRIGDILGKVEQKIYQSSIHDSVLSTKVNPVNNSEIAQLAAALTELTIENPNLAFKWYKSENELLLKLSGPIQQEIIQELLMERYQIDAQFENPTVIYKETPKTKAEGFVRYWMPKPCWAIMKFEIIPGDRGSGVVYESIVGVNEIHQKYQNEVADTILKTLEQGIKGWEVTDIVIRLIEGEDHPVHSRPGDFKIATPMGIMNALKNSDTQLLEPILNFTIKADESLLGVINSELIQRRAKIHNPEFEENQFTLKGQIPVSTSMDLSINLNSLSSGKAKYLINFGGYQACSDDEGQIRPFKGINPLDESLWILHSRGAYKEKKHG